MARDLLAVHRFDELVEPRLEDGPAGANLQTAAEIDRHRRLDAGGRLLACLDVAPLTGAGAIEHQQIPLLNPVSGDRPFEVTVGRRLLETDFHLAAAGRLEVAHVLRRAAAQEIVGRVGRPEYCT